jgi:hypothetical protein
VAEYDLSQLSGPDRTKTHTKEPRFERVLRACRIPALVVAFIAFLLLIIGCFLDQIAVTTITIKAYNDGELKMTTGRKVALLITEPLRFAALFGWLFGLVDFIRGKREDGYYFFTGIFYLLCYSDFSIRDDAKAMAGLPSHSSGPVYWVFFAVKRIPMFFSSRS